MVYGDFKDLPRRATSDKVVHNKAFNIAKNPKYDEHQQDLASMIYRFFDKKIWNTNSGPITNSDVVSENKELSKDLHKPIIRNSKNKMYIHVLQAIFGVLI